MAGFDWPVLMRAGMQGLGLSSDQFWGLTPAEFRLLLGENAGAAPMGRSRLHELMTSFPDFRKEMGQ
ncbi:rcc01693 family protein [Thalassococcus lentus]|uniref:Phage tail assembly chaperone n=1 Tax=Thalassococcus lentus TaxID=1210524 RepID=A0ABT4XRY8_9RHOB|nr:rcc01693 family protein [Thalassococcus lentus]MDA7424667.1 phage tail assembly chaperone [Thalassococcus lentus]